MNLRLFVALPLIVALPISCAKSPPPTAKPQKEINFFDGPQPLAVLIQTDPWSMVIGSDTPLIAIYDDGQVIYLRKEDQQPSVYMHKQLGSQELSEVKQKITSLADFPDSLDYYDLAPGVTDLPESKFYVDLGEEVLATTVYGLKVSRTPLPAYTVFPGAPVPDQLPQPLKELHEYLTHYQPEGAQPWTPKFIEVMIGPFEDARGDLARWPAKWPGLDSPSARQRGDSYSIFLPGTEIAELRQFMQSGSQNSAAEIGGQKWAVSYRYTFPSEPVWFQVFAHEEEEAAEAEGSEDAEETEGMEGEPEDPEGAKPADDGENGDDADETQETDTVADDTGAGS